MHIHTRICCICLLVCILRAGVLADLGQGVDFQVPAMRSSECANRRAAAAASTKYDIGLQDLRKHEHLGIVVFVNLRIKT